MPGSRGQALRRSGGPSRTAGMARTRARAAISAVATPGAARALGTVAVALAFLLALGSAHPALAQTDLGGQRVGTSSGAFLKIPLDARGSAMAGATSAWVSGPTALFWNPAGLGIEEERAVSFSAIDYTAGIPIGAAAICFPARLIRGAVGIGLAGLQAEMAETDEYHPLGTGRDFSYRAWTAALGVSRALTDKLSFGLSFKAFHEDLGTEVGGPALNSWLVDAGAIYFVGYRDARIGIALTNFGPDLRPSGEFTSRRTGAAVRYASFSPPTFFRFGAAIDPYASALWSTRLALEIGHPADNREVLRFGAETTYRRLIALRGGYDFSADALKLHAGFGARVRVGAQVMRVDYSYADGGDFGGIHRWTLQTNW